jgi:hypothetical protein
MGIEPYLASAQGPQCVRARCKAVYVRGNIKHQAGPEAIWLGCELRSVRLS